MAEGKGLVDPLGFSLAAFPGDQMPKWMYGVGLAMYDALAWKWAHEAQSKEEIIKRIPPLVGSKVVGSTQNSSLGFNSTSGIGLNFDSSKGGSCGSGAPSSWRCLRAVVRP